ncbi:MAG: hypothetical protein ACXWE0_09380, partial [Nitrososphaeraceae archaeon]
MKTPICSFDAKTGILCSKCESKLKTGHLSVGDIEASMKLTGLADKNNIIDKFALVGAYKIDEELILILPTSDISILRSNIELLNYIKKEFNNGVWFISFFAYLYSYSIYSTSNSIFLISFAILVMRLVSIFIFSFFLLDI